SERHRSDWTRPLTVFLRQARIESVVADALEGYAAGQSQPPVQVVIGQSKHADAASDPARLEFQIFQADFGDRNLAFHERGIDPKRAGLRIGQPGVESATTAGGQPFPDQPRWPGPPQPRAEAPPI